MQSSRIAGEQHVKPYQKQTLGTYNENFTQQLILFFFLFSNIFRLCVFWS